MSKGAFISSAVMHGAVLVLMAMEVSFSRFDKIPPKPALLMIDLSKVQIGEKTNLPPKVSVKKEVKTQAAAPTPKKETAKTHSTQVQKKEKEPVKPVPKEPTQNAVSVKNTEKSNKKTQNKKAAPKPVSADDQLKSLLASVDKISKKPPKSTTIKSSEGQKIQDGIEGGTEGSLSNILTISEMDLIATQLSKCWLVDGGKKGIEDMIIEIKAEVNRDGSIKEVRVMNMPTDSVKRSVAESAKRAVLVCDSKKDLSPFKILAEKYADHYADWKSLYLRFNPMTGGIM